PTRSAARNAGTASCAFRFDYQGRRTDAAGQLGLLTHLTQGQPSSSAAMSLKERINEDMKAAMRARDAERLGVIRMITAAIKQREVDERITLDDAQVLAVLDKMVKSRKESVAQFRSGGREDLAEKESREIELLQSYLPAQLSEAELDALIADAIAQSGATSVKDMGKAMALIKQQAQGRADMGVVSSKLKARLG